MKDSKCKAYMHTYKCDNKSCEGCSYRIRNLSTELGRELIELNDNIESQKILIDKLELKAAMYRAYFFGKRNLAKRLDNQIEENIRSHIMSRETYRTLEDMFLLGLITEAEYEFCVVV